MEHDVGQEWRENPALRNTLACSPEQAVINMACLQDTPEQTDKPLVLDTARHTADQQPVMHCVKVAGQITFDDPPTSDTV